VNPFFSRNIGKRGRIMRGLGGLVLLGGAYVCQPVWWSGTLTGTGVFLLLESVAGWCVLRAFRIKTPM